MMIVYDSNLQQFSLQVGKASYVMALHKGSYLTTRYFGLRLHGDFLASPFVEVPRSFSPNPMADDERFSLDTLPQEYPVFGNSDFRLPALEVEFEDGSRLVDLHYDQHRIYEGKPKLHVLPSTYVEEEKQAQTLEIDLFDAVSQLRVTLRYTVFAGHSILVRSVLLHHEGDAPIRVSRVMSMAMDLSLPDYQMLHLPGAHAREREMTWQPIGKTMHSIESRRGASSHQQNPFLALASPTITEEDGEVYSVALAYSGNFQLVVDTDQYDVTRVMVGINPFDFRYLLSPGEKFETPEVTVGFHAHGLGEMSRDYHRFFRKHLLSGRYRDQLRPILINNWEATYFQFDEQVLLQLADEAKEVGIELFVLDDGWFGQRDDDRTSLGDWVVDTRKLPHGLGAFGEQIRQKNMRFGLWFEPEMISPDSALYRTHPDWCLFVPGRNQSVSRHQYVLDFSSKEVCDAIIEQLTKILSQAPIDYVKWDMNRHLTEVGSVSLAANRQKEVSHRYMLGVYRVMDTLTKRFPFILFESCSGGGGRFDPGLLAYMPQVWTSDNTDAIARLSIQFGTSLIYPAIAMGSHVSAVPNHQVGRVTTLQTRGYVAMMGNLGYELDLRRLGEEDRATIRQQIAFYQQWRDVICFGDLYRLKHPSKQQDAAFLYVSEKRDRAIVTYIQIMARANPALKRLRLQGLATNETYSVTLHGTEQTGVFALSPLTLVMNGDELMQYGLAIPYLHGDFLGCVWTIEKAEIAP